MMQRTDGTSEIGPILLPIPSEPKTDRKTWLVLFGACLICFMTTPYLSVFGLLYKEKLQLLTKDDVTASVGTWTFAIYLFTWNFVSFFVEPLSKMQSYRWTTSVGIFLMGVGSILSAFANSAIDLFLSVGLIIGSGQGLVTNTVIFTLLEHFRTKPGLVMGVSFAVMALAGIITPQLDRVLLSYCTGHTSILVHGSLMMGISLLGAIFLIPPPKSERPQGGSETGTDVTDASHPRFDRQRIRSNLFESSNDIPDSNHIQIGSDDPKSHNNIFVAKNQLELEQMLLKESHNGEQGLKDMTATNPMTKKTIVKKSWKENPIILMFTLTKWSLLKSPHFLLTALGSSSSFNAILNFYLLLPLHAGSKGFSVEDKSVFLSAAAVVDLFTRFLFAAMGDWNCVQVAFCNKPRRMLYALSVIGIGISMISLTLADSYTSIMAVSILYGIFAGGMPGNGPMVYQESFKEDYKSAMGLASIGRALAALSTGPLSSFSKNEDFGISLSLWFHGGFSIFLMLLWIAESVCCRFNTNNQDII